MENGMEMQTSVELKEGMENKISVICHLGCFKLFHGNKKWEV